MQQCVLLAAIDGEVVVAALAGIHKLQFDVFTDPLDISVVPGFKGKRGCIAAALIRRPLVVAARGVGFSRIRRTPGYVDAPAVGLPARLAGGIVLVGIGDATVVLFAKFVLRRVRIGVAPQPELLDESIPLLIVAQLLEGLALLIGDDPGHVLVQPGLVSPLQLVLQGILGGKLFLVGALPLQRVHFLSRSLARALALTIRLSLPRLLRRCRRIVLLLALEPGSGRENQPATQCGYKKNTAIMHHCLQYSCKPLFYGSRLR